MAQQILVKYESGGCSQCASPRREGGDDGVTITGSVGRGGRNMASDVRTIQSALNEVSPMDGGPAPELKVDGIVGPLTIAAIEKYQRRQIGRADGRVDPDGPTIHALNGSGSGISPAQKGAKPTPPPKATPAQNTAFIARIGALLPRARHWTTTAQMKIDMALGFVHKGPADPKDPFPSLHDIGKSDLALFDKYFHSEKAAKATRIQQLLQVRSVYQAMQTVMTGSLLEAPMFGWGVGVFQPDPLDGTLAAKGYVAYTFPGGWRAQRKDGTPRRAADDNFTGPGDLRQDGIYFPIGKLLSRSDNFMIETIVHELAHFVGPNLNSSNQIGDHTYDTKPNFPNDVNNSTALRTAEMYGYFAAEAAMRQVAIPIP